MSVTMYAVGDWMFREREHNIYVIFHVTIVYLHLETSKFDLHIQRLVRGEKGFAEDQIPGLITIY